MKEFRAGPNDEGRRLDRVLRILLDQRGLPEIYAGLRKKAILVNGVKAEPSLRLAKGDRIEVDERLCPPPGITSPRRPGPSGGGAGFSPLEALCLCRTADILVLNKPRGLATHGPNSLELMVRKAETEGRESSLAFVPGPLHRLDRNTSGVLAFSLSITGAREFTRALQAGLVAKTYLALVEGEMDSPEVWEDELVRDGQSRITQAGPGGALARSRAKPLIAARGLSLLEIGIDTGRTHQIRAQASLHAHPLVGDRKYGGRPGDFYFLHAYRLGFLAPFLPGLPEDITAPLPGDGLALLLESLGVESLGLETLGL